MTETSEFAGRIRARFPEGLTGLFALGGTRTTYILEHNRRTSDPGHIDTMADYADYGFERMFGLISDYFELGGQNIVFTPFSYQLFTNERGTDYAESMASLCSKLMEGQWIDFCRALGIDQYFAGIDTLLRFSDRTFTYDLGVKCQQFNQEWSYQTGRRKVIWEIASMPLYSFWRAHEVMGADAESQLADGLADCNDMQAMHDLLYRYYARAAYGTELPAPHFYLGSNRNGDLKLRSLLPIALLCGGPFRLFYTPYPSLFMTRETLQAILEDLAFGKPLRSTKTDYSGQFTTELLEAEYQRVQELSADPYSTLGFVRHIPTADQK